MKLVGLTGDAGAGKSTFAAVFKTQGVPVFSADDIAKEILGSETFMQFAKKRWGSDFFKCDKVALYKKIADKVFNSSKEYNFVTNLVHDETIMTIKERLKELPQSTSFALVEIPLLFETKCQEWLDKVIYVAASLEKRTEQNASRQWTNEEIARREAKFLPRDLRISLSNLVLENTGTKEEWQDKAGKLCHELLEKFK